MDSNIVKYRSSQTTLDSRSSRSVRRRRGSAILEFALVANLVLLLLLGIVQFGLTFYLVGGINNAAAEGARFASINQNTSAVQAHVISLAIANPNYLTVNTTCTPSCTYGNQVKVTVSYPSLTLIPAFSPGTISRSSTVIIENETK